MIEEVALKEMKSDPMGFMKREARVPSKKEGQDLHLSLSESSVLDDVEGQSEEEGVDYNVEIDIPKPQKSSYSH